MSGEKTTEQLLKELIRMQKNIERKVDIQERFIMRMQMLVHNDGFFSQVIDNLPFPVAIFEQNGILLTANKALTHATGMAISDLATGRINLFNRVTTENDCILEAVEKLFMGESIAVKGLVCPLAMFARDDFIFSKSDDYNKAVFFPVVADSGIICGAVMLMK